MKLWLPGQSLEVLVCGLPIDHIDPLRPYGALRGNATRALGLANNFSKFGQRVGLVVEPSCKPNASRWISEDLRLVARPEFAAAAASAETLLLCSTNLKTLRERVPESLALVHPQKWVASCFDYNEGEDLQLHLRGVVGVSMNNHLVARGWNRRNFGLPIHVVPYGVDEFPYIDDNIITTERPTAIWIGALRLPRTLERIVRFAELNPECRVNVASGLVFDQRLARGSSGSLDQPYVDHRTGPVPVDQFSSIAKEWCGRPPPDNICYLGSSIGENDHLLGSASLALGFSRRSGQQHDDSKVLDYLRSGLPVLADDGQPSHRFVLETGHGCVIPFDADDAALRAGYFHCLALADVERRRSVAALVRDRFGWPAVSRQVAQWIGEDVQRTLRMVSQSESP